MKAKDEWKIYKNVFDQFTIESIFKLLSEGHFEGLASPYKIGKEANIFTAEKDGGHVIVKVYRLESCNFNKMYDYIKYDPRYSGLKKQRRKIIFAWVQREYRNLMIAREVINVPTPSAFLNNVIVMEMIGDKDPAPMLKDSYPDNPAEFFKLLTDQVKKLFKAGLVHGDLSEYNILNYNEKPYLIDFSQATFVKDQRAEELLKRDVFNICKFFTKNRLNVNVEDTFNEIIS